MEFARFVFVLSEICHYLLISGMVFAVLFFLVGHRERSAWFMKAALLFGGVWQVLLAILVPFAVDKGVLAAPTEWNHSATFYLLNGSAMFAVSAVMHFVHLRKSLPKPK